MTPHIVIHNSLFTFHHITVHVMYHTSQCTSRITIHHSQYISPASFKFVVRWYLKHYLMHRYDVLLFCKISLLRISGRTTFSSHWRKRPLRTRSIKSDWLNLLYVSGISLLINKLQKKTVGQQRTQNM